MSGGGGEAVAVEDLVDDRPGDGRFRVHHDAFTSPEVFAREQRHIFDRSWLYLGHESEVEKPGDFVRRTVGGRPVIFAMGPDGVRRAFFNSCPHRGAQVCRQDAGTTRHFQCFYHAWTFRTDGTFVSGPGMDAYQPPLAEEELSLRPVPRLEARHGFWFLSFDPGAGSLGEHLVAAEEYLALVADQSEAGMRVLPGSHSYTIEANWKLLVENVVDGYHAAPLHPTYFAYVTRLAEAAGDGGRARASNRDGIQRSLGGGHASVDVEQGYGRPVARWSPVFGEDARADIEARHARLLATHGPVRTYRMTQLTRNLIVFPTFALLDGVATTIRKIDPLGPGRMRVTAWALAPRDESDRMVEQRLGSFLTFYGPGGFATPDDIEALESCQLGYASGQPAWSDLSRAMGGAEPSYGDERGQRGFWRAWAAHVTGRPAGPDPDRVDVDWAALMEDWQDEGAAP